MQFGSDKRSSWLPAVSVAIRTLILFVSVLPVPLTAAQELGLSASQTTSWLLVVYGLTGLFSLILVLVYRQPLYTTGNLFGLIFVASLGSQFAFSELIGAFIVAGIGVLLVSLFGLTGRLAAWLPTPIVFGLLAGAILPFVARIFDFMGETPLLVGGIFLVYLMSQRFLGERLPPILPALITGFIIVVLSGQLGQLPEGLSLPRPELTTPVFSLPAIITVSPVLVVLMIVQSNLPSMVFIRDQGYRPPVRRIDLLSGVGTIVASPFGPTAVSVSLPATALLAGPEAGEYSFRYRNALLVAIGTIGVGLLAGLATVTLEIVPEALMLTLAGLAFVRVLSNALRQVSRGPLIFGPVVAFAVASSDIALLGLGPYFWSLVIGTGVSMLLEGAGIRALGVEAAD
jgi:benzoate membrane transport protein